jgi:protein-S-isoprenylcysteine O-methyltransferase Ste14
MLILGVGLILSSPSVILLGFAFLTIMHVLVVLYEEPALARRFGVPYQLYRTSVHRWMIRKPGPMAHEDGGISAREA